MSLAFNVLNVIAIALLPFVLYIFDVILHINEYSLSRIMRMVLPKHFIGRENYFYLIILHSGSAVLIGGILLIATLTIYVAYVKHVCGMFKIAR